MCPDAAISATLRTTAWSGTIDYCKGCGICAYECPVDAIEIVEEGE